MSRVLATCLLLAFVFSMVGMFLLAGLTDGLNSGQQGALIVGGMFCGGGAALCGLALDGTS